MDKFITETIRAWAFAHKDAKDNPRKMIENPSSDVLDECVRLMKVVADKEAQLMDLQSHKGLPAPLMAFYEASEDRACAQCWLCSAVHKLHPDCERKIHRYFRTMESLLFFGLSL